MVREGLNPSLACGHSLGEYGALCLAGVFSEKEALTLVTARAKIMQRAADQKPGAMAAVLNLSEKDVDGLCELASSVGTVVTANYNTQSQTVVSGEAKAVSAVVRFAEKKNGRAVVLPVSGAFHSPLMNEAAREMTEILNEVDFQKPRFPVIPNATGETESDPGRLKQLLGQQMTAPVLWTKTSATLGAMALDEMVECWPKLYVGTLVKKCLPQDKKILIRAAA
jgi:[acyl-carrier-protein] S-malonyltransferase